MSVQQSSSVRLSSFMLFGKCKGFTFVHPVSVQAGSTNTNLFHLQDAMEFNSLREELLCLAEITKNDLILNSTPENRL